MGEPTRYRGDGFELVTWAQPFAPRLHLHHWSSEVEEVIQQLPAVRVMIEKDWSERGRGLRFLERLADRVIALAIDAPRVVGLGVVSALENLEFLSAGCATRDIDFVSLNRLRTCQLGDRATTSGLELATALDDLALFAMTAELAGLRRIEPLRALLLDAVRGVDSIVALAGMPLVELDLRNLRRLESIAPAISLRELRRLRVIRCKRIGDVEALRDATNLRELRWQASSRLESLAFLGELSRLEELHISESEMLPGLSLAALSGLSSLKRLELQHAKGLRTARDVDAIGDLEALEYLVIAGGPDLPSLDFVRGLHALKELTIADTTIVDGQLGVLLELPSLERVRMIHPHADHYSHSGEEIDAVLAARQKRAATPPDPIVATLRARAVQDFENARADRPADQPPATARLSAVHWMLAPSGTVEIQNFRGLYSRGVCADCWSPQGARTDRSMVIRHTTSSTRTRDGVIAIPKGSSGRAVSRLFSERFLALLSRAERDRFRWRAVEIANPRKKDVPLFELLHSSVHLNLVALRGGTAERSRCQTCGLESQPYYQMKGDLPDWVHSRSGHVSWGEPRHFVAAEGVPEPTPSMFTVGSWQEGTFLVASAEREMPGPGEAGTFGIAGEPLGIVTAQLVDAGEEVLPSRGSS